jgi:hypothetical protein
MLGLKSTATFEFNLESPPPPMHPLYHLQIILHYAQSEAKPKVIEHMLSFLPNVTLLSVDDDIRLEDLELTDRPNLRILAVPASRVTWSMAEQRVGNLMESSPFT